MSTGANPVPRRRFQRGSLVEKSGRWYGVYRVDVLQADGTFNREPRWQPLGLVNEQSQRAAWRQFQPYLDRVNEAATKLPSIAGLTLAEFVEEWRASVAVNLKGSNNKGGGITPAGTHHSEVGKFASDRDDHKDRTGICRVSRRQRTVPQDSGERAAQCFFPSQNGEGLGLCVR